MAFDIGAGLSEMGKSVAQTAQAYTLESQKAELENQKVMLADQLAGAREEKQRGFLTSERLSTEQFTGGENSANRASSEKVAGIGAAAHLGAAGISAGAAKYSADLQYKAHQEALTPAEVRTAQWFAKASPDERAAYQNQILLKAGMPPWAVGGGASNADSGAGGTGLLPGDATDSTPVKDATGSTPAGTPERKADVTGAPSALNEDALRDAPPEAIRQVKAMIEGRQPPPTSFAASKPYWQAMLALANKYDPTFDQTTWASRVATRKDFTAGKAAVGVTALNTALGHAGVLTDAFDKLSNSSVPAWNAVANTVATAFGDDRVTNARMAIDALASEARKVFAASGGGSLTELENWEKNFPVNGSPTQQKGAMKQFVDLLDSRLMALSDQYNRGMGRTSDPLNLLEPKAREVFAKLIGREPEGATGYPTGQKPAAAARPEGQGAAAKPISLPPPEQRVIGRTYPTPTGPAIWMGNGWARVPQTKAPTSLKLPPLPGDEEGR